MVKVLIKELLLILWYGSIMLLTEWLAGLEGMIFVGLVALLIRTHKFEEKLINSEFNEN